MEQQRALQRYEETWLAFTEELKTNPTVTTVTKDKCAIILIRSYRPQSSTCAT